MSRHSGVALAKPVRGTRFYLAGLIALASVGCSSSTEPDRVRVIAFIATSADAPQIELPDTVERGAAFTIRFSTYGDGCTSVGETEVEVNGGAAVVTPYAYTAPPGSPCTRELRIFEHSAVVQFADIVGRASVVVRGRRTFLGDQVTTEVREVWVR